MVKRSLLGLLALAAVSGCAHNEVKVDDRIAREAQTRSVIERPHVKLEWNGYKVSKSCDATYTMELDYFMGEEHRKCRLKLPGVELKDEGCDGTINLIRDKTGVSYRKNGPKNRFELADEILKMAKEDLGIEGVHKKWEELRWKADPLHQYRKRK